MQEKLLKRKSRLLHVWLTYLDVQKVGKITPKTLRLGLKRLRCKSVSQAVFLRAFSMCDSDKDGLLDFSDFARSFSPHSYSTSSTSSAETSGTGAGVLPSQRNDASDARPSSRLQVNRLAVTAIGHERLHRELSEKVHAGLAKSKSMGKNSPSNPNVLKEILEKFGDGSGMLDLTQFANAVKSPFGFRCTTAHADDIKKLFEMYVRTSGCSSSNAIDIRRLCNRLIPLCFEFVVPRITRPFCNDAKTVGKGPVANLSSSSMMKEQADSFKAVPWALDLRSKEEVKKTLEDESTPNAVGMQLLRDGKNRAGACEFVNERACKGEHLHPSAERFYLSIRAGVPKMQIITTTQEKA